MLSEVIVCMLASLLLGCLGYSDTSPEVKDAGTSTSARVGEAGNHDDLGDPPPADEDVPPSDARAESSQEADGSAPVEPAHDANLRIGASARFASYLMDRDGQPLYMFAEDIAGAPQSACLDACKRDWPPLDLEEVKPEAGIIANELTRFHRQDGSWQVAYKGHPLYYRAAEQGGREVTGDGLDGRWFVARDYLAFLSMSSALALAGRSGFGAGFLTNGFGRTLYVCLDDTPGDASTPPVSSCVGECARRRPIWSVSEAARTTLVPSLMNVGDIGALVRPDGAVQLSWRGWPVYYFNGDEGAGDTHGQNQAAWRAIDPLDLGRPLARRAQGTER